MDDHVDAFEGWGGVVGDNIDSEVFDHGLRARTTRPGARHRSSVDGDDPLDFGVRGQQRDQPATNRTGSAGDRNRPHGFYDALVSDDNPPGDFPFFDLSGLLGGIGGRDPWAAAAELASAIASDRGTEPNLDPVKRLQIDELGRVAELHLGQAPGISLPPGATLRCVTKGEWARRSVTAYKPFLERFGEALSAGMQSSGQGPAGLEGLLGLGPEGAGSDPAGLNPADLTGQMLGQLFATIGPMLVSTSAGTMIGQLALRALGQYDLPIPRRGDGADEVLIVPPSIDLAAEEWGVPVDELRLWVLLHELAVHSVLSVPHVGARLEALLLDFASAFRPNDEAIAERFGSITDLSQLQELSETLSDPDVILSLMRTPAHDLLVPQLDALVAAVLGFVDHTVSSLAAGLIPSHEPLRQRFRQRWADVAPADRFMERLLGLEIDGNTLARGEHFIAGLIERAGNEGLERLWADELDMPTAAEVDAPGLWLARIGHDGGDAPADGGFSVPDDLSGLDEAD